MNLIVFFDLKNWKSCTIEELDKVWVNSHIPVVKSAISHLEECFNIS